MGVSGETAAGHRTRMKVTPQLFLFWKSTACIALALFSLKLHIFLSHGSLKGLMDGDLGVCLQLREGKEGAASSFL